MTSTCKVDLLFAQMMRAGGRHQLQSISQLSNCVMLNKRLPCAGQASLRCQERFQAPRGSRPKAVPLRAHDVALDAALGIAIFKVWLGPRGCTEEHPHRHKYFVAAKAAKAGSIYLGHLSEACATVFYHHHRGFFQTLANAPPLC